MTITTYPNALFIQFHAICGQALATMAPYIKMALVNVRWLICLNHYHYGITTLEAAPFVSDTMQSPSINRNAPYSDGAIAFAPVSLAASNCHNWKNHHVPVNSILYWRYVRRPCSLYHRPTFKMAASNYMKCVSLTWHQHSQESTLLKFKSKPICHSVAIKIITIHVIEVVISITTIITYLHNYI
jgi:hypothetical protein